MKSSLYLPDELKRLRRTIASPEPRDEETLSELSRLLSLHGELRTAYTSSWRPSSGAAGLPSEFLSLAADIFIAASGAYASRARPDLSFKFLNSAFVLLDLIGKDCGEPASPEIRERAAGLLQKLTS